MVIVDTSVWIDSIRSGDARLAVWIASNQILQHPFVTAEIGMGSFSSSVERSRSIELLDNFPQIAVAEAKQFHAFVTAHKLYGTGIGFADAHLLLSCTTNQTAQLATSDCRLADHAQRLGIELA